MTLPVTGAGTVQGLPTCLNPSELLQRPKTGESPVRLHRALMRTVIGLSMSVLHWYAAL